MPAFIFGAPPFNRLVEDPGWARLEGYGASAQHMLRALGVGIGVALVMALAWRLVDASALPLGTPSMLDFVIALALLMIGHEAVHLLAMPGAGLDRNSAAGLWLEGGSPFAQHLQPMSRARFILVTICPLLVLSVAPLLLHALGGPMSDLIAWTSVLNGVGSGADLLACALLLRKTPRQALVLESEQALYWKPRPINGRSAGSTTA
jgi:Putative zincin peptidase